MASGPATAWRRATPTPRRSRAPPAATPGRPNGDQPGSNLAFMREHYLDAYGIDHAILSPLNPSGQGEQNIGSSASP